MILPWYYIAIYLYEVNVGKITLPSFDRNKSATINFSRSVLHSRLWELIPEENTD